VIVRECASTLIAQRRIASEPAIDAVLARRHGAVIVDDDRRGNHGSERYAGREGRRNQRALNEAVEKIADEQNLAGPARRRRRWRPRREIALRAVRVRRPATVRPLGRAPC
jgi:hypothetical protein